MVKYIIIDKIKNFFEIIKVYAQNNLAFWTSCSDNVMYLTQVNRVSTGRCIGITVEI